MTRRRPLPDVLFGATLAIVLLGCTSLPTSRPSITAGASQGPSAAPGESPEATEELPTEPPSCAEATLDAMTEAQRVGQLLMAKLPSVAVSAGVRDAVVRYHVGNWWYGRTTVGVAAMRAVSDDLQALATIENTGGAGFLISANQEGGLVQGISGPGFDTIPSAVTQGTWAVDDLTAKASIWGGQLADAGINTNFAPVADVVPAGTESRNAPIGQLRREYGSEPGVVADHVGAFISGMQDAGILTTAKHFPGLGRVLGNTDSTAEVVDSTTTVDDPYLDPFQAAIDSGTDFVMISLATYTKIDPDNPAVFSPLILGDLLRGQMGFSGVIMSDSLSATAVLFLTPRQRAIRFLEAGGDLIVLTPISNATSMIQGILARAATNPTFKARVDDAALRVLEAKDLAGLLPCD